MLRWLAPLLRHPLGRLGAGGAGVAFLLLTAVPLGLRVGDARTALAFLVEFLTEGRRPWLSTGTRRPERQTVVLAPGAVADLWRVASPAPGAGLVLVHGLTPLGKDDPRLAEAAALLARGGLRVMVPDLPELRHQRLRPDDTAVVRAALAHLAEDPAVRGPLTVLAVSVGVQPALAAAAGDPRVGLVVSLGGYADARELVRYFTTGAYGAGSVRGRAALDRSLAREFLAGNLDLVADPAERAAVQGALAGRPLPPSAGAEARAVVAVLANEDPARVDALLAALPPRTQRLLDTLSPARDVRRLRGRLVLVHGRDDPAVPFTESLRLATAADPARTRLVLVDLLAHVEGRAPAWRQARDLGLLWTVAYELFRQ